MNLRTLAITFLLASAPLTQAGPSEMIQHAANWIANNPGKTIALTATIYIAIQNDTPEQPTKKEPRHIDLSIPYIPAPASIPSMVQQQGQESPQFEVQVFFDPNKEPLKSCLKKQE